jgi:hypothetical protein
MKHLEKINENKIKFAEAIIPLLFDENIDDKIFRHLTKKYFTYLKNANDLVVDDWFEGNKDFIKNFIT